MEDENHLLHYCDLYADLRNKLITRLNNAPQHQHESLSELNIDCKSLKDNFMTILSPYSSPHNETVNTYNMHHNIANSENESESQHRRSYLINCVCTFLFQSIEKRQKYIKEMRDRHNRLNTLIIKF